MFPRLLMPSISELITTVFPSDQVKNEALEIREAFSMCCIPKPQHGTPSTVGIYQMPASWRPCGQTQGHRSSRTGAGSTLTHFKRYAPAM